MLPSKLNRILEKFQDLTGETKDNVDADDLSFASSASAAILYQSPKGGQYLLWLMSLAILLLITWAAFAEVEEFTRAQGQVIPSQYLQIVQNLEGGIVAEVFVNEGEQVKKNQPLVRLDDKRFSSDLNASENRQEQLMVKSSRLLSESRGSQFSIDNFSSIVPEDISGFELALYQKRSQEQENKKQIIRSQIEQKRQQLSASESKAAQLRRSYQILQQELKLTEPLLAKGAVSEVEVLRLQRKVNDLEGEMHSAQLFIPEAKAAIHESELKLEAMESAFRSQAQADYNQAQEELSTLQKSSQSIVDQVDRTLVRSPVKGTIKQLFVKTLGGVIQPGNNIVSIVPTQDKLRVEARVSPVDIAFLHPGQKAMVKLSAYDFSIYGGLLGKVIHISPDTIIDREGNSFYMVQVETEHAYLGDRLSQLPIIAGMTVSVDILTGKKTILDYILKPILKTKQYALRER